MPELQQDARSKVPQFGARGGVGEVGFTKCLDSVRKGTKSELTVTPEPSDVPQLNRHMQTRMDPSTQADPAPSKSEPKREAQMVPPFGSWEGEDEAGFTQSFENVRKNNKIGHTVTPEPSSDAPPGVSEPPAKEGRSKLPHFGDWKEARKNKTAVPVPDPIKPQLNRDVNNRARPSTTVGTKFKADGRHQLSNASRGSNSSMATSETLSSSIHQKRGRLQQRPPAERGNQTPDKGTAIPAWGVWNTDPQQVEGFTGAFTRAKEERSFVNWGRIPLLDEDSIVARGLTLGRADNDDTYGGGKRLKVKPTDSNHQDVGQFGNASKSVPASTVGSETPFHDKTKLIQVSIISILEQ
uniref:RIN4 pathogenic type III effector avirulence factor Avr cleavage site domain-containing protein n=1 Tax=Chenopodium quinoa TaxID=63459 RepID=A0A803KQ22_CHEQI